MISYQTKEKGGLLVSLIIFIAIAAAAYYYLDSQGLIDGVVKDENGDVINPLDAATDARNLIESRDAELEARIEDTP